MKQFARIIDFLLVLCIALSLSACKDNAPDPTAPAPSDSVASATEPAPTDAVQPTETLPSTEPPGNAEKVLYDDALGKLLSCQDLRMQIDKSQDLTVSGEVFSQSSSLDITYLGLGTENMTASVTEKAVFAEYETDIEETYVDGIAYSSVYGSGFSATMTAAEYTARYLPVQLIDADLYSTVTMEQNDNGTVLHFTDASDLEDWLKTDLSIPVQVTAEVVLNNASEISSITYAAEYTSAGARINVRVTVDYSQPATASITAPKDADSHTVLTYLDGPRIVEQIYGYLQFGENRSFTQTITTYSDAAGVYMHSGYEADTYGSGNSIQYHADYSFYATDYYNNQSIDYTMEELFQNGKYTVSYDDEAPVTDRSITASTVSEVVVSYLTEYVYDCAYFTDAVCTDLGSLLLIEFTGSQEFGESICKEINTELFGDEDYLDDYATAYKCIEATYYVAVDKYLGLPTALGYYYEGSHTIDGYEYMHFRQMDQAIYLASLNAYEAINDVSAPDNTPETNATPAFYHVTGPNGQEMWLLGTIHVGDDRTGYLPQEIYDAYNAADALAVECNVRAFEKESKNDEDLQEQILEFYYYSGSTTEEHINDEELYKKAVQRMKATGNFFYNAPYLKVSVWSGILDDYLLQQCYSLSSDKGVDNRLLMMAEADGKKILEVETNLSHVELQTSWSDALSLDMLQSSLEITLQEYYDGITEMYELWCSGDEDALIEYLKEDTSELTEEELVLYNEYNKAMCWDRNIGMTQVAIDYLESGETVFYAVGLAHVLAEDGLVNTLRDAGYTVELVEYDG